jgi:hypothetical protein
MEGEIQVIKPGHYHSVHKPSIVVEVVTEAELRTGEMRNRCVIYARAEKFYVRSIGEFLEKFRPVQGRFADVV